MRICLYCEDRAHERVLRSLVRRISSLEGIDVELDVRNSSGGIGKALSELERYFKDLEAGRTSGTPDFWIVAIDANCKGIQKRKQTVLERVPQKYHDRLIPALPDPHIERWLLMDSSALKKVFGKSQPISKVKCNRDVYKHKLIEACRIGGLRPLLGGLEHADDIIDVMKIDMPQDESLKQFVSTLRRALKPKKS